MQKGQNYSYFNNLIAVILIITNTIKAQKKTVGATRKQLLTAWFCFLQLAAAAASAGFMATAFAVCTLGAMAGKSTRSSKS